MRVAVIPARGGSKRIRWKNIVSFHGKPIIAWSIEAAIQSCCFNRIVVSTDSEEIAEIARRHGAEVPFMRPRELADDHTGTVPVIRHAAEWFASHGTPADAICCIYATAPLVEPREIREGLILLNESKCDYVFTATAFSHPIQRAIRVDGDLRAKMFYPEHANTRSQDLEPAWHDAAQFYWGTSAAWQEQRRIFESNSRVVPIPRSRAHDVDTPEDLERLEMLFAAAVMEKRRQQLRKPDATIEDAHASNRLSLGTVQFGMRYGVANDAGQVPASEVAQVLRRARHAGIHSLDTAVAYGESEAVLGSLGVKDWEITTKLPSLPDNVRDVTKWARGELKASTRRLGVNKVHGILLHRPDQLLGPRGKELAQALLTLKEEGATRKIGASVYSPQHLGSLLSAVPLDMVQIPFSILDQRLLDSGWLPRLKDLGIEVHARSVFLQGLLLLTDDQRPEKFNRWTTIWRAWSHWLTEHDLSALQACLLFVLSVPEIDRVVVGVDGLPHLEAMLKTHVRQLPTPPDWPEEPPEDLLDPSHWNLL